MAWASCATTVSSLPLRHGEGRAEVASQRKSWDRGNVVPPGASPGGRLTGVLLAFWSEPTPSGHTFP